MRDRPYTRRELTTLLALAGTGTCLAPKWASGNVAQTAPVSTAATPIPSWPTELRRLASNVYAYTQASGPGVDNASLSNAGVIAGPDGLLAIDTLGPPIHAKAFKATAEAATGQRFTRVLNTHHHRDHTNGNCFFAPVEIVSSAYTRQATIDDGIPAQPYDTRPQWQEGMSELRLAPPTTTLSGGATYRYGDIEVEVVPNYPAHTFGDLMVYLPRQRICLPETLPSITSRRRATTRRSPNGSRPSIGSTEWTSICSCPAMDRSAPRRISRTRAPIST